MCFKKEDLEDKVREVTLYPLNCDFYRAVICIWNSTDEKAQEFCNRLQKNLKQQPITGQVNFIDCKDSTVINIKREIDSIIINHNHKLNVQNREGYYILFINVDIKDIVVSGEKIIIEFLYLFENAEEIKQHTYSSHNYVQYYIYQHQPKLYYLNIFHRKLLALICI